MTSPDDIDALEFFSTDAPTQPQLRVVDDGLGSHNDSAAPLGDVRQLASFATDSSGSVVGGAVGRTWGQCCELLQLWVAPDRRNAGVGSRLLSAFEAHARTRRCRVFYLTTFSFQAPDFYGRHGYKMLASIDGFPNGIVKYLMHKREAWRDAVRLAGPP